MGRYAILYYSAQAFSLEVGLRAHGEGRTFVSLSKFSLSAYRRSVSLSLYRSPVCQHRECRSEVCLLDEGLSCDRMAKVGSLYMAKVGRLSAWGWSKVVCMAKVSGLLAWRRSVVRWLGEGKRFVFLVTVDTFFTLSFVEFRLSSNISVLLRKKWHF